VLILINLGNLLKCWKLTVLVIGGTLVRPRDKRSLRAKAVPEVLRIGEPRIRAAGATRASRQWGRINRAE